jgi:uncharacterized protein YecT (DUF1311 family)
MNLKSMSPKFAVIAYVLALLWLSSLRSLFSETPAPTASPNQGSLSPDKKWEYSDGDTARLVKTGTNDVAVEFSEACSLGALGEHSALLWAPDSNRFGYNYHVHGSHGYSFRSVAFYELRGEKWEELGSPADDVSEGSQLVQLLKEYLPKKFNPRDCSSNTDVLDLREWTDASNAILYAPCYRRNSEKVKAGFLFTLKFDAARKWKIVKTHQMSEKEIEKEEAGEDVSGPAKTTEQEGLSADASFRDADRHLNKVYNALRARLSPPERDRLRKEQLAWINRRNAAAQVAKGNAEGNPTDAGDGDVTKMTLVRAAELEKRLKKAK